MARVGLLARTLFYLVLVYLVVEVAADRGNGGRQANAHGGLTLIARNAAGEAALVVAAIGFAVFGVVRVVGAVRDRQVDNWRRLTTALQGLFYVVLATVPASFVLGRRQTGSEQQQHAETATVVSIPIGVFLVVAAVQSDPRHADGLDAELGRVAHHGWGPAVLALVALGLLVFAAYSGLEARFRDVSRGV